MKCGINVYNKDEEYNISLSIKKKNNETFVQLAFNSDKFNKYTRCMYNQMSKINGLNHYYYFVKSLHLNNSNFNFDYEFQKITYTDQIIDMSIFKNFISKVI